MSGKICALVLASIITLLCASGRAHAQGASAGDGALFLLLPVGARAAAMGNAATAAPGGGESIWWNPAGLAAAQRVEALLHHSQSLVGVADALTVVAPFSLLGVLALSASTVNFGEQELSETPGGPVGILVPRSVVLAATFAADLDDVVRLGLSYKLVQMRADCSGACQSVETLVGETSAIDFGIQVVPGGNHPLSYGVAIKNVGPRLQVVDTEQADALPSRVHLAVQYNVTAVERHVPDTRLLLAVEGVDRLKVGDVSIRFGAELVHQSRLFLRGGYITEDGAGATLGGGVVAGNVAIDIARALGGLSADLGEPPTHISIRYRFR